MASAAVRALTWDPTLALGFKFRMGFRVAFAVRVVAILLAPSVWVAKNAYILQTADRALEGTIARAAVRAHADLSWELTQRARFIYVVARAKPFFAEAILFAPFHPPPCPTDRHLDSCIDID